MSRNGDEKLKILYIRDYLLSHSDEEHPVSVDDILNYLEKVHEITPDKRSIRSDIRILGKSSEIDELSTEDSDEEYVIGYGMDIHHEKRGQYYVGKREFSLPELRILVDSVQSSKYISPGRSQELIRKLKNLTSEHNASRLQRSVRIMHRIKSADETVIENVGLLSDAIEHGNTVKFRYKNYDVSGVLVDKGKNYDVAPFFVMIDDENYYLVGWDNARHSSRNYRIDKMSEIKIRRVKFSDEAKKCCAETDMESYGKKAFSMFGGTPVRVKMRFKNEYANAAFDILGNDIMPIPESGDKFHFSVTAEVIPSPHFYGWVTGLGEGAEIVSPPEVREGMRKHLEKSLSFYK